MRLGNLAKDETKASLSLQNRIKQILVEQELLHIVAINEGFWQPHALRNVIKSRLAERFDNPQFTVSTSQVRRAKDKLSAGGFILSQDHPDGERSFLRLRFWGLLCEMEATFRNEEGTNLIEKIDELVKAQSKMLIIFKKWSYIDCQGLKPKAIELMQRFFASYPKNYHRTPICNIVKQLERWGFQTSSEQIEEYQLGYFCDNLFLVYDFLPRDEQWYKMLAGDKELNAFASERFRVYRKKFLVPLKEIDERATFFKD